MASEIGATIEQDGLHDRGELLHQKGRHVGADGQRRGDPDGEDRHDRARRDRARVAHRHEEVHVGDRCRWHDCQIEIVDMDGNRIDKVIVTANSPRQAQGSPPTEAASG